MTDQKPAPATDEQLELLRGLPRIHGGREACETKESNTMNAPRMLTIRGITMPMCDWARRPGAASYAAICKRVTKYGWSDEDAVFLASQPGKSARADRMRGSRIKRETVVLTPAPYTPPPFRPTIGRFRSFPMEALEMLRRVA